ncbi:orotate phosphoribosyltransferase [Porphyromonadaceae bacterium W3.11]|nr:orotate phosphoribosyltransferase [Porphyromonadaceae bacterium W3.11]
MEEVAKNIAKMLMEVEAVKLKPEAPFTWASGWKSPIYCDNRVTLSSPRVRTYIKEQLAELIKREFPNVTAISGVATGAIAQGALVSDLLALPFSYIRSKPKDHGMENLIEGRVLPTDKVVVVEDLISTGGSSLKAVEALRQYGCEVLGMVAIYTHGLDTSVKAFEEAGVKLYTLSNYNTVIQEAIASQYITKEQEATLQEWRKSPDTWGK